MYISHYDIRQYYRCPMLFYLNEYGPENEKKVHPIIQTRRRHTKTQSLTRPFIDAELKKTYDLMQEGPKWINQCWIGFDNKVAKINRLTRNQLQSNLGSYSYFPTLLRNTTNLRKPMLMEGTFNAYICSEIQEVDVDHFIIQQQKELVTISVEEHLLELKKDLLQIEQIKKGELVVSPNYTRGCRVCEWRLYCKQLAAQTSDLTLISGIGRRVKSELNNYGINDVPSLAEADVSSITLQAASKRNLHFFQLQAQSLVEKKEIIREQMTLPKTEVELFVDIEGSSHHNFVWIIGCLIRKEGFTEYIPFQANSPREEKEMLSSFLKFLEQFKGNYTLYHWSSAELQYFRNLITQYSFPLKKLNEILKNSLDLFPIFKEKIVLPLYSYTLKDVANWLGFKWHDPLSDGATSIVLFDKWYNENDKKALEKVVSYNSDDCKALMIVKDYISKRLL